MTTAAEVGVVPAWTLGWRLQRALEHGGIGVQEIATHLEVSRATVARWMHDVGAPPRKVYVAAWATATGVSREWLLTGEPPDPVIRMGA